ncbi:hypothetical protein LINPERPRIM_LOCUS26298 [Linum perenne]
MLFTMRRLMEERECLRYIKLTSCRRLTAFSLR